MSIQFESVSVSSLEEAHRIATGQANNEDPHLTVPFYMPLAHRIPLSEALESCRPDIRKAVKNGKIRLLAIAHGEMADRNSSWPVQFVLLHGKLHDDDPDLFLVFDSLEGQIECAVLIGGNGLRCRDSQPISNKEAVAYWMGGFLGWNEKSPGLYRLRYALIES